MEFEAGWEAVGKVVERKPLSSKKSDWKGWMIRVQVLGATVEIMCNEQTFGEITEGDILQCRGRLEQRTGGGYSLELEHYRKAAPKSVA